MKEQILTRLNESLLHPVGGTVMVSQDDLREMILEQGADERNVHNAMEQIAEMSEQIGMLKRGLKGDYDLDAWLEWATHKKRLLGHLFNLKQELNRWEELGQ